MRDRVREAAPHLAAIALAMSFTICANAQNVELPAPDGKIVIPPSSIVRAEDIAAGRAHTNIVMYIHPDNTKPGPTFKTPASIACVYRLCHR